MCRRYTLPAEEIEILQETGIDQSFDASQPSYNIITGFNRDFYVPKRSKQTIHLTLP